MRLGAASIRLAPTEAYDLDLRECDRETPVEVVEADRIGRRRGQEYARHGGRQQELKIPPKNSVREQEVCWASQAREALSAVIKKKIGKTYPRDTALLINMNFNPAPSSWTRPILEPIFAEESLKAGESFSRVLVWWADTLYRPFPPLPKLVSP